MDLEKIDKAFGFELPEKIDIGTCWEIYEYLLPLVQELGTQIDRNLVLRQQYRAGCLDVHLAHMGHSDWYIIENREMINQPPDEDLKKRLFNIAAVIIEFLQLRKKYGIKKQGSGGVFQKLDTLARDVRRLAWLAHGQDW